jgi:hypothetical protein
MPQTHKTNTQFNISSEANGPGLDPSAPIHPAQKSQKPTSQAPFGRGLRAFVTGAIFAGSALLGGLAVVLWNRRTLSGLRQPGHPREKSPAHPDGEEE